MQILAHLRFGCSAGHACGCDAGIQNTVHGASLKRLPILVNNCIGFVGAVPVVAIITASGWLAPRGLAGWTRFSYCRLGLQLFRPHVFSSEYSVLCGQHQLAKASAS